MQALLAEIRAAQDKLRQRTERWPELVERENALARLEARLSTVPRIVLLGESNSGKTSVANLVLDQAIVPHSVVANVGRPLVLRCAETLSVTRAAGEATAGGDGRGAFERLEVGMPNPRLASFDVIDMPGLSNPAQLDALRLRASDLLVWCTLVT